MALGLISRISEIVGALVGREGIECVADCGADRLDGSCGSFAEQMFELGTELFDWVQVG
jgi:hypothetical protein